jgi:hypothetical protein
MIDTTTGSTGISYRYKDVPVQYQYIPYDTRSYDTGSLCRPCMDIQYGVVRTSYVIPLYIIPVPVRIHRVTRRILDRVVSQEGTEIVAHKACVIFKTAWPNHFCQQTSKQTEREVTIGRGRWERCAKPRRRMTCLEA